jgi:hypothetical protein
VGTKIRPALAAVFALTAWEERINSYSIAWHKTVGLIRYRYDSTHNFVTQNGRGLDAAVSPAEALKVHSADAGQTNPKEHLARTRLRIRHIQKFHVACAGVYEGLHSSPDAGKAHLHIC